MILSLVTKRLPSALKIRCLLLTRRVKIETIILAAELSVSYAVEKKKLNTRVPSINVLIQHISRVS